MIPTEILRRIGRKVMRTIRPVPPTAPHPPSPATASAQAVRDETEVRPAVFANYTEPGELAELGVLFMPLAEYHGRELGAIADELRSMGYRCSFLVQDSLVEVVDQHLGDHPRVLAASGYDKHALGTFSAFIAMNDWGEPSRDIYHLARLRRIPSFAKVEGVQDFTDVDTGRIRLPYLAADHVLVQGGNDTNSLDRRNLHVVGNANMEHAWNQGPAPEPRNGEVVINSNFTYGVLTDVRDSFLRSAIASIHEVDLTPVISQHPADRGLPAELKDYRTDRSMSSMLPSCEAVVTRFSTVPFEAIAYGTPFVYFNPHHEKVPTFTTPSPAFDHVHSADDLRDALRRAVAARPGYRSRAEAYFRAQIDMTDTPSAARAASAIASVLTPTG